MPKIEAATVKEHRELVLERLVDSAEQILQANPEQPLTAHAVAEGAGVARNSIYRYVASVSDLVAMVIARHLPPWLQAVDQRLCNVKDPAQRICVWVLANLEQATHSSHTWLMQVANGPSLGKHTVEEVYGMHEGVEVSLVSEWSKLGSSTPLLHSAITRAILESGFRAIDVLQGDSSKSLAAVCPLEAHHNISSVGSPSSIEAVIETVVGAVAAMVVSVAGIGNATELTQIVLSVHQSVPTSGDDLSKAGSYTDHASHLSNLSSHNDRTGRCPVRH